MISIRHLTFKYKQNHSYEDGVIDINFEIPKGECVLLCGRSGCGKSTLIKLLNGLIPRYFPGDIDGEIWIDNKRIDAYPMYELSKKVGSVFQNPRTQFFNVDVNSEIVFGMENFAMDPDYMRARRERVLSEFDLSHLADNSIFNLSGGEKQRVAVASVYAQDPEIYLLDEPSSNLDTASIDKLAEYLKTIKQQGKTILIAEHRLYYLMDLIDRVIYMEKGHVTKDLTRDEFAAIPDEALVTLGLRTRNILPIKKNVLYRFSSTTTNEKAFSVRNLSIEQAGKALLSGIHFSADFGDVIGIVGRNGIGKTTLIRYLCGLHKKGAGDVTLDKQILNKRMRTQVTSLVMQDVNYQLFAESVLAECSFGLKAFDPEEVEHLLKTFDLWDYRFKHPNTLSGGQKQRLAVIASCISHRKVLIFDEPTSGLDYDSMISMAEIIKEIAKDRIVFVVTHDDEFIEQSCTGVVHLEEFVS